MDKATTREVKRAVSSEMGSGFPCISYSNQITCPIVRDSIDLEEILSKLSEVCKSCELRRTANVCEFQCSAQAGDGWEQCKFTVSVWHAPHSGKYLLQADRLSGCPFFFNQLVAKSLGGGKAGEQRKLFRCPKLPESMMEDSTPDQACVDSAIRLATSTWYEQRVQGIEVLADLIAENPRLLEVFKGLNGFERIAALRSDVNDHVQRAYSRILVCA
jgi:hypothetical protein